MAEHIVDFKFMHFETKDYLASLTAYENEFALNCQEWKSGA